MNWQWSWKKIFLVKNILLGNGQRERNMGAPEHFSFDKENRFNLAMVVQEPLLNC